MAVDLDKVIEELQKPNGWRQGWYGMWDRPDGAVCLLGAARRVTNDYKIDYEVGRIVGPAILEYFPDRTSCTWTLAPGEAVPAVDEFNDHPDTTLDDVILVCEKARANQPATGSEL